jgi:hypothetical protein
MYAMMRCCDPTKEKEKALNNMKKRIRRLDKRGERCTAMGKGSFRIQSK